MNISNNIINYGYIDYIIKYYVNEAMPKNYKINLSLFKEATRHKSATYHKYESYDRLEFLGDSIFHYIITDYIYKRYEDENEGFLTKLRIRIEKGDSMTEITKILKLDNYIQIHNLSLTDDILEDVFEAFIGAFYINFGMLSTKKLIISIVEKHKDLACIIAYDDNYKDILLRYYHQMQWEYPTYQEDYKDKKFISSVKTPDGKIIGTGYGSSKRKAEQYASQKALTTLGVIKDGIVDDNWLDKIDKNTKSKKKVSKKPLPTFNVKNTLIDKDNIKNILKKYHVLIKKDAKIRMNIFYEATTHQSYVYHEKKIKDEEKDLASQSVPLQKKSNCRLRFLGDTIKHFVVTEYLFNTYKNKDEGFLTKLRSKIENKDMSFFLAKATNIVTYILVSQHIEILHGRNNAKIFGNGFEAFIGALYIEFKLETCKDFILNVIKKELNIEQMANIETNYKDVVLQIFSRNNWGLPVYKSINETGPDHLKVFTMGLYYKKDLLSQGVANSIKGAEQLAAKIACENILLDF